MAGMIADAIFSLDHDRHSRRRPDLSAKAKRLGSPRKQAGQVGQLLRPQFWRSARRGPMAQRFCSQAFPTAYPLAHCSFGHTQSGGDVFLFPSLLLQFPGAQASPFAPVFWKRCVFAHTPLSSAVRLQTLELCSEINKKGSCSLCHFIIHLWESLNKRRQPMPLLSRRRVICC
jgi:hypothetical protein